MNSASTSTIDWQQAKRQISELGRTLAETETVTAEEAEAILRQRAERLARAAAQEKSTDDSIEVMILHLAGERHALETLVIREVIRPETLTPLPGTASQFAGIMNLRGRPLLIIDGKELLQLPQSAQLDSTRIIVVGDSQAEFGLLADSCDEVARIDVSTLVDPPQSLNETARRLVRGVTQDAMAVFDTDRLRNDPRLWINEQED